MSPGFMQCAANASPMQDFGIKVRESGPYLVKGRVTLEDADGNQYVVEGENFALCRCGGSATKPFCDGTHRTNGFDATERSAKTA